MLAAVPTVSDDDVVDVLADVGGLANLDYRQLSEMVFTNSLLLLTVLIQLMVLLAVSRYRNDLAGSCTLLAELFWWQ